MSPNKPDAEVHLGEGVYASWSGNELRLMWRHRVNSANRITVYIPASGAAILAAWLELTRGKQ